MRLTGLLLGVLVAVTPAHAQRAGPDGFSICVFTNSATNSATKLADFNIGPCQPLTDQAMQSFGLSASQMAIVATLRSAATNPGFDPLSPIGNGSLAAPKPFAMVGAFADYWLADMSDVRNVNTGVHLHYRTEDDGTPQLFQMTYAVDGRDGHFTVLWNQALAERRQ